MKAFIGRSDGASVIQEAAETDLSITIHTLSRRVVGTGQRAPVDAGRADGSIASVAQVAHGPAELAAALSHPDGQHAVFVVVAAA